MMKIINGRRYDTEKAHLVGEYDNMGRGVDSVDDFRFWQAALYRTPKSGQYFIAGFGGPMSRFAQSAGSNRWEGGWDLIPMTRQEALEWAEVYLRPYQVEEEFGDMIDDA
jgi:hypothetical protein